jgi:ribosomal protein L16 Arg81 hydroxylase
MTHPISLDFEQLITPLNAIAFFDQYWEKRPLVIKRSCPEYYKGIFSIKDVDALLQHHHLKYPNIKLGKKEQGGFSIDLLEGMNANGTESYGVPNLHRLYRAYAQGDTIIFNRLFYYWQPLAVICQELEKFFSCSVGANVYLSPRNSQSFPPHYDLHDIFVLQVEGSKHWKLYDLTDKSYTAIHDPNLMEDQDVYLEAGDLLYIPQQYVHSVYTTDSYSMHISIGVDVSCSRDLLSSALSAIAVPGSILQQALPIQWMMQTQQNSEMQTQLVNVLQTVRDQVTAEDGIAALARRLMNTVLPSGQFH